MEDNKPRINRYKGISLKKLFFWFLLFLLLMGSIGWYITSEKLKFFSQKEDQDRALNERVETIKLELQKEQLNYIDEKFKDITKIISELMKDSQETSIDPSLLAYSDSSVIEIISENLIRNSSFEFANNGHPRQWNYILESSTSNTIQSNEGIRSGKYGLKFTGGTSAQLGISQPITKTVPGRNYTLSFYLKSVNVAPGTSVKFGFWDEYNNKYAYMKEVPLVSTKDWYRVSTKQTTPGQIIDWANWYPIIEVRNHKTGAVYIDDLLLSEGNILPTYSSATANNQFSSILGNGSVFVSSTGTIFPAEDAIGSLGTSAHRWDELNLKNATINSNGDMNLKGNLTVERNLTVGGSAIFTGDIILGQTIDDTITFKGTSSFPGGITVGENGEFVINSSGNITKINGVSYSYPSSQGGANQALVNDGNGNLSWAAVSGGVGGDSLDFTEFMDNLTVDANTSINLYDSGAKDLRFYNSNSSSEILFLDGSTNRTGIGTTDPAATLDINGTLRVGDSAIFLNVGLTSDTNQVLTLDGNGRLRYIDSSVWDKLASDDLTASTQFTGDVSGLYNSLQIGATAIGANELESTTVTTGSYGSVSGTAAYVPTFTVDADGRLTAAGTAPFILSAYESPLSFLNGLTRAGNNINLGGSLTQNTRFFTAGTEIFYLSTTGNIGIGTTTINDRLEIAGGATIGLGYANDAEITAPPNGLLVQGNVLIGSTALTANMILDVAGNIRAGTDVFIGSIGLNDTGVDRTASGASLIGVNHEFSSYVGVGSTNVQDILDDLDAAITTIASGTSVAWTDAGAYLYPTANESIGNPAAGIGKITGMFLGTTAPLVFGAANNYRMIYDGTNLILGDTSNTFLSVGDSGTTGNFNFNSNQMYLRGDGYLGLGTTAPGAQFDIDSTSTSTAYKGFELNWIPTDTTTLTGDLFSINIGPSGNAANLFAIYDNNSKIFSVSESQIESAAPHIFTAAGDVSMSYDLYFTNATASYINFEGPGYIRTTHPSANYNLTLSAANLGKVYVDDYLSVSTSATIGTNYTGSTAPTNGLIVEGNVGIGTATLTSNMALDVVGNIRAGTDVFIGSIGLNDTGVDRTASGASLVGVNHEFNLSNVSVGSTNVQDVLDDLDQALTNISTGTTGLWLDGGSFLYPASGEYIGSNVSGSTAKLRGIYLGDTSPIVFGASNNYDLKYSGGNLILGDTSNTFLSVGDSGTTGNFDFNANQMYLRGDGYLGLGTTAPGAQFDIDSTSTSTAYKGFELNWIPTDTTTLTGDLFSINIGPSGNAANLFAIYDNGSKVFSVSESQIESAVPHSFTASGDVSIAYDLNFTNVSAAYVTFDGPGYLRTFNPSGDYDLTLSAANDGTVYIDDVLTVAGNVLPSTADTYDIGNTANEWNALYVGDSAGVYFGADQDFQLGFDGTSFRLGDTSNAFLTVGDSGTTGTFAFNTDDVYIGGDGNVGIGTTNPNDRLEVAGGATFGAGYTNDAGITAPNNGLLVQGRVGIGTSLPTNGYMLDVGGSVQLDIGLTGSFALCTLTNGVGNNKDIRDCSPTASADYMEFYSTTEDVEQGDLVAVGDSFVTTTQGDRVVKLKRSTAPYQASVIGIASNPAEAGDFNSVGHNIKKEDRPYPVALNGRVKVKVTAENGSISAGDLVAASSIPGYGMKATQAGMVVGQALEDWDPSSGKNTVMVFVKSMYSDPDTFARSEDFTIARGINDYELNRASTGELVNKFGAYDEAYIANLSAGKINTSEIVLSGVDLSSSINGLNVQLEGVEAELSFLGDLPGWQDTIESRIDAIESHSEFVTVEELLTLKESLEKGLFETQTKVNDLITRVDELENESSQEADLSSLTDRISFLEQMVFGAKEVNASSTETASDEAKLENTAVLEDLKVIGKTNLYDLGVVGDMSVGQIVVRGMEATINSLSDPIQIQSEASAPVEIMDAKVVIDTNGSLFVKETIKAKKYEVDDTKEESASIGESLIKAGETEVTIGSTSVTESSKIFLTNTNETDLPLAVVKKIRGKSFKVKINKVAPKDIKFNWWIVN